MISVTELGAAAEQAFVKLTRKFGLRLTAEEATSDWQVVVFQNETSALRLYREHREGRTLIQLFQLREGHTPLHRGVLERSADPDNGYDFEDLLGLRLADPRATVVPHRGELPTSLVRHLEIHATLLDRYAADVLQGDFGIFRQLREIVQHRREQAQKRL